MSKIYIKTIIISLIILYVFKLLSKKDVLLINCIYN